VIDRENLGVHHVNERVPQAQGLFRDIGFLPWGGLLAAGLGLVQDGRAAEASAARAAA